MVRVLGFLVLSLVTASALGQGSPGALKIGVLNDQSGLYSDVTGKGSVLAARMAVEDAGGKVLGRPVEIVVGDHQNKADVGNQLARRWFDQDGVEAIVDLPNSAVALSVLSVAREKKKVVMFSGALSPDITGKLCIPTSSHWAYDTYALANTVARTMVRQGYDTWYFLSLDNPLGQAFQRDATHVIESLGGKVVGSTKHPLNSPDFSSYVLQAQASKAKAVALANGGGDTVNAIKSAAQFGLSAGGQHMVGLLLQINDVHALGLKDAQGIVTAESYYWDADDSSRVLARRFMARSGGTPPNQIQAGVYSATRHYLKAVVAAGTVDGTAVAAKMKELPIDDAYSKQVKLREDGRVMRDFLVLQVKSPSESKGPWDYYKVLARVPGGEVHRPLEEGGCPLVSRK